MVKSKGKKPVTVDARNADKFMVRLREGMRDAMEKAATAAGLSMNSLAVDAIARRLGITHGEDGSVAAIPHLAAPSTSVTVGCLVSSPNGIFVVEGFFLAKGSPVLMNEKEVRATVLVTGKDIKLGKKVSAILNTCTVI